MRTLFPTGKYMIVLGNVGVFRSHAILLTRPFSATASTCQVEFYVYMTGDGVGKFASFFLFIPLHSFFHHHLFFIFIYFFNFPISFLSFFSLPFFHLFVLDLPLRFSYFTKEHHFFIHSLSSFFFFCI